MVRADHHTGSGRGEEVVMILFNASRERLRSAARRLWPTPGQVAVERQGWRSRVTAQWRTVAGTPLRPQPMSTLAAIGSGGTLSFPNAELPPEAAAPRPPIQARDFYCELDALDLPPRTLRAVHAFIATLPSWLAPPLARRCTDASVELSWTGAGGRRFLAKIDGGGMVIYSARLGDRGRVDAAEPIGDRLSPIVLHAIRQLAP